MASTQRTNDTMNCTNNRWEREEVMCERRSLKLRQNCYEEFIAWLIDFIYKFIFVFVLRPRSSQSFCLEINGPLTVNTHTVCVLIMIYYTCVAWMVPRVTNLLATKHVNHFQCVFLFVPFPQSVARARDMLR